MRVALSPETYLKKHQPPRASGGGDKPQPLIRPREVTPDQPHARTRRNDISRFGERARAPPLTPIKNQWYRAVLA